MEQGIIEIAKGIKVGDHQPLLLIAGPCQIQSKDHCLMIAEHLLKIGHKLKVKIIFKSSYDKANRTSLSGKRGLGLDEGLRILEEVRDETGLPVLTDIHSPEQATIAGKVVDVLQTPAFLCRQTDLLIAAGATGKVVNIKKGQFLHPSDMRYVTDKVASTGNKKIMLCERGTSFGYRDLVVDMRSIVLMKEIRYPVIFDATHSVQMIGSEGGRSGGQRKFIAPLALSAVTAGADGLFIECHEDPDNAPSDGPSMLPLEALHTIIEKAVRIRELLINS